MVFRFGSIELSTTLPVLRKSHQLTQAILREKSLCRVQTTTPNSLKLH